MWLAPTLGQEICTSWVWSILLYQIAEKLSKTTRLYKKNSKTSWKSYDKPNMEQSECQISIITEGG